MLCCLGEDGLWRSFMRIVTRGDFDSLISSVLISLTHEIDNVLITNPYEIITELKISENDIVANLPYHANCGYWFDHHHNEEGVAKKATFNGYDSAATLFVLYVRSHKKIFISLNNHFCINT